MQLDDPLQSAAAVSEQGFEAEHFERDALAAEPALAVKFELDTHAAEPALLVPKRVAGSEGEETLEPPRWSPSWRVSRRTVCGRSGDCRSACQIRLSPVTWCTCRFESKGKLMAGAVKAPPPLSRTLHALLPLDEVLLSLPLWAPLAAIDRRTCADVSAKRTTGRVTTEVRIDEGAGRGGVRQGAFEY